MTDRYIYTCTWKGGCTALWHAGTLQRHLMYFHTLLCLILVTRVQNFLVTIGPEGGRGWGGGQVCQLLFLHACPGGGYFQTSLHLKHRLKQHFMYHFLCSILLLFVYIRHCFADKYDRGGGGTDAPCPSPLATPLYITVLVTTSTLQCCHRE